MTAGSPPSTLKGLEAQASALRSCPAWPALESHAKEMAGRPFTALLTAPDRFSRFSREAGPAVLDFSRQQMSEDTLRLLLQLAEQRSLAPWIEGLFAGEPVNSTEQRPAMHMALRRPAGQPMFAAGVDVMPAVRGELKRVLALADEVGGGRYKGYSGQPIEDVVNIGIGGSDLGLVMAVEALRPYRVPGVRVHCVSNIDGTQLVDLLEDLVPDRTLFIVCSKSFTTQETQLNADAARRWLVRHLPEAAVARHFVAVSVNDSAMDRFGIAPDGRFRIWDWVGGRYSLWSAIGLLIAIAIGRQNFEQLLAGAHELDEHFRTAPLDRNLPVLMGLIGVWNQNFLGSTSHVVLPYSQRLNRFPAFLQQLEMESNGKSITRDGKPVAWNTGSLVWGEPGSNAQHAFFQLLHQGTAHFSADFIAPANAAGGDDAQHLAALTNMLAQAEAFACGRTADEVRQELQSGGAAPAEIARLVPHKVHPGNRPSSIVLLRRLDPRGLGFLIALYEHKVFVQSVIWGINAFDQWGVELGKTLAKRMGNALGEKHSPISMPRLAEVIRAWRES